MVEVYPLTMTLKTIPEFPDYQVSSDGRVWSTRTWRGQTGRWLKPKTGTGYQQVNLYREGRQHDVYVHHLVAEAFLGPRPGGMEIRHLNGNQLDNRADNLAWGTHGDNERDKVRHGTHRNAKKTRCPAGHPYAGDNLYITPSTGDRICLTCKRARRRDAEVRGDDTLPEDGGAVSEPGESAERARSGG